MSQAMLSFDANAANVSSLAILEDFYGEQVSRELVEKIRTTPPYQLGELAQRIASFKRAYEAQLRRPLGDKSDDLNQAPLLRIHDRLFFEAGDVADRYRMISSTTQCRLAEHDALKHVLLLADKVGLHDQIAEWAWLVYEAVVDGLSFMLDVSGPILSRLIAQILPIAGLIRSGAICLIDRISAWVTDGLIDQDGIQLMPGDSLEYFLLGLHAPESGTTFPLLYEDPYLAWVTVYKSGMVKAWERSMLHNPSVSDLLEAARIVVSRIGSDDTIDRVRVIRRILGFAYPHVRSWNHLHECVGLATMHRTMNIDPITSLPDARRHLLNNTRLLLDGPARSDFKTPSDALGRFVQYKIPDLSAVSLSDVIGLRQYDEIYGEVRACLDRLVLEVGGKNSLDSYSAFRNDIEEMAEDVVGSAYERLSKAGRRGKLLSTISGYGAGGVVSVAINGIATFLSGVPAIGARGVANAAGNTVRESVKRKVGGRAKMANIGAEILLSLMSV